MTNRHDIKTVITHHQELRSRLALMTTEELQSEYRGLYCEQVYCRAQSKIREGTNGVYTWDVLQFFRDALPELAESRKQIRTALKARGADWPKTI